MGTTTGGGAPAGKGQACGEDGAGRPAECKRRTVWQTTVVVSVLGNGADERRTSADEQDAGVRAALLRLAAVHENGLEDEALLMSSRELHEPTDCRIVAVALTLTEASALAEGSANAVVVRSSKMLGGIDWSAADTIQLAKMQKIMTVAAGQLGIPTAHWERMLASGLQQPVPTVSAKDMEERIQKEVEKRVRDAMMARRDDDGRSGSNRQRKESTPVVLLKTSRSTMLASMGSILRNALTDNRCLIPDPDTVARSTTHGSKDS